MMVFLIGMPACGKSRIGRNLAKKISFSFYDLDKQISNAQQKSITQIFLEKGEEHFRKIETEHLLGLSKKNNNTIVSLGGGTPCFNNNMQQIQSLGTLFYLNTPVEILAERIKKNNKRPLFLDLSLDEVRHALLDLIQKREPFYSQAHYTINTEKKSDAIIIEEIAAYISPR
ncbi:MAG: shikimate kinase [Bacteroidetes bacterium]|nr:shikimate kinase [Bacteroidota bacterium]